MAPLNPKRTAAGTLATLVLAGTLTACGNGAPCSPAALESIQGQTVAAISVAVPKDVPQNGGGGGRGFGGHADGAGHGDSAHVEDPATGGGSRSTSSTPIFPFLGGHSTQCPTNAAKP